ncbi:hypothetical protein K466DRAFT_662290 [Polyporus arcularius HHB13444]|uniref:Fungal-type protein kinase domain-containing protein n=1 Tax=Polyporus arcularius HHB13444 TaxID=1314778 RepID=A0A5C3PFD3_9APHY|nr:hypothetical protein K466DRAFT_662290 [Polyporus arcularius HHB13444]
MHRKIIVLEYSTFLERTMNHSSSRRSSKSFLSGIMTPTTENDMYNTLPEALNKSGMCPGYTFVATPHGADGADPTKQAVDCGMYKTGFVPQASDGSYARVDWSRLELAIECKTHWIEQDPFDPEAQDDEPTAQKRQDALGQILSYAELVFKYQQRTWHFMIILLGDFARIVRFDRSTIFATNKFNYKTNEHMLSDFIWRYSRCTSVARGHDPTATQIERGDKLWNAMIAKKGTDPNPTDHVQKLFYESLDEAWPWWQLEVQVEPPSGKPRTRLHCTRKFLVGKPHFQASGVTGRGTRGYVALPLNNSGRLCEPFVYLKDAWRVDHTGIEKEGDTLHELNQADVPYVPTLICHGDLKGPEQTTDWRSLWKQYYPDECPLQRHQHYRLVVKQVGKPLTEFGPGFDDLVMAIGCILEAHAAAYRLGIIHRDISAGNMLLYKDDDGEWYGLLNDWELSRRHDIDYGDSRQPDRTGTWQFMSVHAADNESRRIILPDELESIFHVLLYLAVRFLPHNLSDENVGQFLHDYFDGYSPHATGYRCSAAKRGAIKTGMISLHAYNGDQDPHKLTLRFGFDPSGPPLLPLPPSTDVRQVTPSTHERAGTPSKQETRSSRSFLSVLYSSTPWHSSTTVLSSGHPPPSDDDPVPVLPPPQEKPTPLKRTHPLNDVVEELLTWFKAYYALDSLVAEFSKDAPALENTRIPSQSNKVKKMRQKAASRSTSSLVPLAAAQANSKPVTTAGLETAAKIEEYRKLADNLTSHDPFIALIYNSLDQPWPENDKGEDKKPKGGSAPRKDQVAAASETVASSKKRPLEEKDAKKERAQPPKRRKASVEA